MAIDDLRALLVQDAHQLVEVLPGVADDLVRALREPGAGASGRVAHLPGEAPDHEDGRMPEVLELTQLAQHDGVPQRQVGAGRVDAQLHPHRAVLGARREQPFGQSVGGQDLRCAGGEDLVGILEVRRKGVAHVVSLPWPSLRVSAHPA